MTDTERGLLDDVLAHPDQDWPRLIYADWLEDSAGDVECGCDGGSQDTGGVTPWGESINEPCQFCNGTGRINDSRAERAEFIRVQCELAKIEAYIDTRRGQVGSIAAKADRLRRREAELFSVAADRAMFADSPLWGLPSRVTGHSPNRVGMEDVGIDAVFRRGFVAEIHAPLRVWLAHGPALCRAHPVEAVTLTDIKPHEVNPGKWRFQFFSDWAFGDGGHALPTSALPESFRPHMTRNSGTCRDGMLTGPSCCYDYRTEADALADANAGALEWANSSEENDNAKQ